MSWTSCTVGFLIVQDLVVVIAMIVITAIGVGSDDSVGTQVALTALRGVGFLVGVGLLARYVLPSVLERLARSSEVLVLFGLAWAVSVAAFSDWVGLSMEVGAFVAGVSLASTPYREALGSRLVSLRDILILFFFIDLGSTMEFAEAATQVVPALVLSAFVLIGNPLIVMVIMGLMGYRKRVSFLAGLTVAQISEFSLILAALALSIGHIGSDALSLVTLVGIVTIGLSTYLILYSKQIFERIAPFLSVFERSIPDKGESDHVRGDPYDAVVIGAGRFGGSITSSLLADMDARVLVVDHDPEVLHKWRGRGAETLYGDISEPELVAAIPLTGVQAVICTIPDLSVNLMVLDALRRVAYPGTIALTALSKQEAVVLTAIDGVLVLRPFADTAETVVPQFFAPDDAAEDEASSPD